MTKVPDRPLVSVYIASKNRRPLLEQAIDSVLCQTYRPIEIIVVDDGSDDDTHSFLEALALKQSELKFYRFEQSRGAPAARNKAIELACGDFVTGLDDDDLFCPNRVEDFIAEWASSKFSFLCSRYVYKDRCGEFASSRREGLINFQQIKRTNVIGNQIFVPRASMLELGGFDCSLKSWQDYDMWLRLMQKFGPAKRIASTSYIVDQSEDRVRITASSNAHLGYLQFIEKHRKILTKSEITLHRLNDLFNRNESIALSELLSYLSNPSCFRRGLSVYLKSKYPNLYRALAIRLQA